MEYCFDLALAHPPGGGGLLPKYYSLVNFPSDAMGPGTHYWSNINLHAEVIYRAGEARAPESDMIITRLTDANGKVIGTASSTGTTGDRRAPAFDWRSTVHWQTVSAQFERSASVTRYPGTPSQHAHIGNLEYRASANVSGRADWDQQRRIAFGGKSGDILAETYNPLDGNVGQLDFKAGEDGSFRIGHGFMKFTNGNSFDLWDKYDWFKNNPTQWAPAPSR